MTNNTLTRYLLTTTDPASTSRAFEHPFLKHAGRGTVPDELLERWLGQDIHYTRAYVRFIGQTLSGLRLPFEGAATDGRAFEFRVLDVLVAALNGIQRETTFFENTAVRYGLQIAPGGIVPEPGAAAQDYQRLFEAVGGEASRRGDRAGLLRALVLLWATEYAYLTSWREAQKAMSLTADTSMSKGSDSAAVRALHEAFIPNWTSTAFEEFVEECAKVVNELAIQEGVLHNDAKETCRSVWMEVLRIEEAFWPRMGVI
jgi:thiaminase